MLFSIGYNNIFFKKFVLINEQVPALQQNNSGVICKIFIFIFLIFELN